MTPFPKQYLTVGGEDPFLPSLLAAINYANRISITSAFIRLTGLRLIQDALLDALKRGSEIRILTGDYLSITDPNALSYLMLLKQAGAQVRVFESGGVQSFHMKAYLFCRSDDGLMKEGCAFVGSSNISKSALETGLEWNLRVDWAEDKDRFAQIFDEYEKVFADSRSKELSHDWIDEYRRRIPKDKIRAIAEPGANEVEEVPTPNAVQNQALSKLTATRNSGYRRGLVVMATGLGKTWLAAFDCKAVNAQRILFVAHREEILEQAEQTFVRIMPDARVGKYNGKEHELNVDMLFASVQTLGKTRHLEKFRKGHFDYIVVDEFHHAAASTYRRLLAHFEPGFLIGLTATPDRTDQSDILHFCDDNLVFSEGLFDGIKAKLLCPFHYHGVGDETVDYQEIKWRNGKFDPNQLLNQLATTSRARHNLEQWRIYRQKRTLAFCISKKHADFMSDYFNRNDVISLSVHSDSDVPRNVALEQLRLGEIDVLFSVDLFNEGIDLPSIDTVMMLRPTESKIIFLQQLGRGLRTNPESGKEKLVVLDFIGNHTSFFRKPEALFGIGVTNSARKSFIKHAKDKALPLPEGCFVNYDLTAIDFMERLTATSVDKQVDVYQSLKESYGRRPSMVEFYNAGGAVDTIRREHGQWLRFVDDQGDLTPAEQSCLEMHSAFLLELELTKTTKSFKLILLESMVELEGFSIAPTIEELSARGFEILQRRRILLTDLPEGYRVQRNLQGDEITKWTDYWKKNPINAWIGGNSPNVKTYFKVDGDRFYFTEKISESNYDEFTALVSEINSYRYLQYESRLANRGIEFSSENNGNSDGGDQRIGVPFFTDLKIACGHFASSDHRTENMATRILPSRYGQLDESLSFIAQARGDSMDGGQNPIRDGDFLLMEAITAPDFKGLDDHTVAIELKSKGGDDQYLLRDIAARDFWQKELVAKNPKYPTIGLTKEMDVFAQFKAVITSSDVLLHQKVYKQDASKWFGIDYKEGVWKMPGHVCPKETKDQFFFVTLNKQGIQADYRYHDRFEDASNFHWQSQRRTTPESAKGQNIINHERNGGNVHLFVRKNAKTKGKASPFIYCGRLTLKSHSGSAPMDVKFALETPLSAELFEYFKG